MHLEGEHVGAGSDSEDVSDSDADSDEPPEVDYQWLPACSINRPGETAVTCPGMYSCESEDETKWYLWGRELPDGEWRPIYTDCYSDEPPGAGGEVRPQVTDAVVLREVRRVGLPAVRVSVQPEGTTLVNLDTIFYTEPPEFARTVSLLGYAVDIRAEPTEYLWHHGDGSTQSSTVPGAPYPAMDIIHRYTDAHVTVHPSVDVTYRVRWRVDDTAWHTIEQPLTAAGPASDLRIKEAVPVLTDPYR